MPNLICSKTPSPQLQQWLMSGNDAATYKNITSGTLNVKAATSDFTAAIAPSISDLRLLLGAKLVPTTAVDQ